MLGGKKLLSWTSETVLIYTVLIYTVFCGFHDRRVITATFCFSSKNNTIFEFEVAFLENYNYSLLYFRLLKIRHETTSRKLLKLFRFQFKYFLKDNVDIFLFSPPFIFLIHLLI